MVKRAIWIVVALVAGCLAYLGYRHYAAAKEADSGAVLSDGEPLRTSADSATGNTRTATRRSTVVPEQPQAQQPLQQPVSEGSERTLAAAGTDSLAPNAPNGAMFSGSGKFQIYRQGDLTWRLDTETGKSCILFATMAEWRKPIVYQHGCNNS